jgi:YVTN family beta-propeller protein
VIDGASNTTATVVTGTFPNAIALNPVTNKIYVANRNSNNVTVIDGASNTATTVAVGTNPQDITLNPVTNKVYVTNFNSGNVTVITPSVDTALPLTTTVGSSAMISGLGNATPNPTPAFTFTTNSSYAPTAPTIRTVYYQIDSVSGSWTQASGSGPFTATLPAQSKGNHVLYAYAVDSLEGGATGGSSGGAAGNSPMVGSVVAYPFTVINPLAYPLAQTITFGAPPSISVGANGSVTATGGASGNPVIFSSNTPAVCTVSGTNGSTVTGVSAGTCTIAANQAGNANYNAAPQVTQSFNVTAAAPTTFTVTPSAGANGTISPATSVVVNSGATSTFTVTPNSGYSASVGGTCGGLLVGTTYTTNAITANCTVIASFSLNIALNAVQSRKTHGAAGTFDLAIDTTPLIGGAITVEPRVIGAGHQIVFQFNQAVTSIGSATAIDVNNNAIGSVSAVINSLNTTEVIVTLTGVADVNRVRVSLTNASSGSSTLSASASIGFLVGDVNNSRSVNSSDINAIKTRSGQVVDTSNFKFDLNASGGINTTDINAAKTRSGGAL